MKSFILALGLASFTAACSSESGFLTRAEYTPDGNLVVFSSQGLKILDAQVEQERKSVAFSSKGSFTTQYSLAANGSMASLPLSGEAGAALFQLPEGKLVRRIEVPAADWMASSFLSPSADLLFAFVTGAPARAFRTSDGELAWSATPPNSPDAGFFPDAPFPEPRVIFSADGKSIYFISGKDLGAIDTATGTTSIKFAVGAGISSLALLSDQSFAMLRVVTKEIGVSLGTEFEQSYAIFSADGQLLREFPQFPGYDASTRSDSRVVCSPVEDLCAVFALDVGTIGRPPIGYGALLLWRTDGTLVQAIPLDGAIKSIAFSPDGQTVAVVVDSVRLYRIADGTLMRERRFQPAEFANPAEPIAR